MNKTTEDRLSSVMHAVTPQLAPPAGLATRAVVQSRRRRHRIVGSVAVMAAVIVGGTAVMILPGAGADNIADGGPLTDAPDWSGCAARLPLVNDDLGARGLQRWKDAVEVAVCGEVVGADSEATMDVHVAGASDARRIAKAVLDSAEGSLIEGCLYEVKCELTFFAIRMADGSVARLVVTDLGGSALVADASTSRLRAGRVLAGVQQVQAQAPSHTYHAGDTPPPFAIDGFECPDDVPWEDWQAHVASPGPGAATAISEPIDRLVICAYAPYNSFQGDVPVLAGIGLADQDAVDLVRAIEAAPRDDSSEDGCNQDAGYAFVLLVGSGDVRSRVLYAEAFGCRVAGDVTPVLGAAERLQTRSVTNALERRLLDAVGRENLSSDTP